MWALAAALRIDRDSHSPYRGRAASLKWIDGAAPSFWIQTRRAGSVAYAWATWISRSALCVATAPSGSAASVPENDVHGWIATTLPVSARPGRVKWVPLSHGAGSQPRKRGCRPIRSARARNTAVKWISSVDRHPVRQ
ncbi:hypothetical protein [Amycolatopsis sp. NPDC003731]